MCREVDRFQKVEENKMKKIITRQTIQSSQGRKTTVAMFLNFPTEAVLVGYFCLQMTDIIKSLCMLPVCLCNIEDYF
jgi:hypothetical protein